MVKAAMFSTASDAGLSVQHKFDVGSAPGNNAMKIHREVLSLAGRGRDTRVPQTFERGMPAKTG